MPKQVTITPEVRDVLERGEWHPDGFQLPPGQLDRKLYTEVDRVLQALGGRWSRQLRLHVFSRDARAAFDEAMGTGVAVDQKRMQEQFFTPAALAADVVALAKIEPGMSVLEPSAGEGALIKEILVHGGRVWAYETDPRLREHLVSNFFPQFGAGGLGRDFMDAQSPNPVFDRVVMNPPFGNGAAVKHVLHALGLLKPGGILVAIMPPTWRTGGQNLYADFRSKLADHLHDWTDLPAGSFREADTMVNTGILVVRKGEHA